LAIQFEILFSSSRQRIASTSGDGNTSRIACDVGWSGHRLLDATGFFDQCQPIADCDSEIALLSGPVISGVSVAAISTCDPSPHCHSG
jgi:hypothetical protein